MHQNVEDTPRLWEHLHPGSSKRVRWAATHYCKLDGHLTIPNLKGEFMEVRRLWAVDLNDVAPILKSILNPFWSERFLFRAYHIPLPTITPEEALKDAPTPEPQPPTKTRRTRSPETDGALSPLNDPEPDPPDSSNKSSSSWEDGRVSSDPYM